MVQRGHILAPDASSSRSLYERLREDDLQEFEVFGDPSEARFRSIKENTLKILNGRKGGALSCPDFGLEDLNDAAMSHSDTLSRIAGDIAQTIRRFEPRLYDVVVTFDRTQGMGLVLYFNISASTRLNNREEQLVLDLALTDGRKFISR